jgi:hypothetical protein
VAEDNLASLKIAIEASLKDFSSKMGEFENVLKGTEAATQTTKNSFGEMAGAFAVGQLAAGAVTKAFEELIKAVIEGIGAADEQALAVIRLTSDLGAGAEAIVKWSEAQEKKTRFSKADSESAATSLTIHKLNREEIEKLLPVIEDYASKKGVSATATAEAFGRAIEYGTTRGLRPYGIELEKSGSQQDIFNELVAAGQGKVKGMAEQMGQAGLGPAKIFNNQMKEISEEFGSKIIPYISDFIKNVGPGLLSFFEKVASMVDKIVKGWGAIGSFLGYMAGGKSMPQALEMTRADNVETPDIKAAAITSGPEKSALGTTNVMGRGEKKDDFWTKQHEVIKSNLEVYKAQIEESIKDLSDALKNSGKSVDEWYVETSEKIAQGADEQIAVQREIIRTTSDANEKAKATNEIAKIEIETRRKQIDLAEQYKQAQEKLAQAQKLVEDAQERAMPESKDGGGLEAKFAKEMCALKNKQDQETATLTKGIHTQQQLDDLITAHKLENINKVAEFEKEKQAARIGLEKTAADAIGSIANDLYELTGSKSIALFNLGKTGSIAQATINTFEGVTKAIAQGGVLGIVTGVLVGAAGALSIAKIIATQPPKMEKKATGGLLEGPSHAAGGMNYEAEGGEFIQQRSAVNKYGTYAMNAINRGLVSPSAMRSAVSGGSNVGGMNSKSGGDIHITNINDPRMIDRHLASADGRASLINHMGQNKMAIRKALGV